MSNTTSTPPRQCYRTIMLRGAVTALIAANFILTIGCGDDPPVTPEPVAYNIYVSGNDYLILGGGKHNGIWVYDADSLKQVDYIPLQHICEWMKASPDGRYLYALMWRYGERPPGHYLAKLDATTGAAVWTIEEELGVLDYDPDLIDEGRLLVYGKGLLIDTQTGRVISNIDYPATRHLVLEHGPSDGTEIAAIHYDSLFRHDYSDTLVLVVDVTTGDPRGGFVPRFKQSYPMSVYYARLHPDRQRVLLIAEDNRGSWFVVGDIVSGEMIMYDQLSTHFGQIAISQDGSLAVVVDEANAFFGYGVPAIYVYDINHYERLCVFDPYNDLAYWPGQVRFLPGDRRIAVFSPSGVVYIDWLQTFDLNTMSREHVVDTPFYMPTPGGLAVGPRPLP